MDQLEGFSNPKQPYSVCELHKALYGLKQALRAQFDKLSSTLQSFGFQIVKSNSSLFIRITDIHTTYVLVYVDDILAIGSSDQIISQLVTSLKKEFTFKDLASVNYFLGIQVRPTEEGLQLSQTKYIGDLLNKSKMQYTRHINTYDSMPQIVYLWQ